MTDEQRRINTCTTLRALCAVLGELDAETSDNRPSLDQVVDISNLPTFGGETPATTDGVFSWNESHLLVTDGSGWRILPR